MREIAIDFTNVTFGFSAAQPLFSDLCCSLSNGRGHGRIIALMGPSGVGKSTFCGLTLGLHEPQSGLVKLSPSDANVAFIPQKGVIFEELSVEENLACLRHSKTLGKTFTPERVQLAIESLGLSDVVQRGTGASALSGGELQRLMLGRIQAVDCDVLILDEPCSFLDNRVKASFLNAVTATVTKSRLLALMVTHVWDEAQLIADDVYFFHQVAGQPVTLYAATVSEAESHPPTIDALYAIHWPNCALLDLATASSLAEGVTDCVVPETRFVGLFPSHQAVEADWARTLWHKTAEVRKASGTPPRAETREIQQCDGAIAAIYYNGHGLSLGGIPNV